VSTVTPEAVRERLATVVDPCSAAVGTDLDIVEMGLVESVEVAEGHVTVSMRLTSPGCLMLEYFNREVDEAVGELDGVDSLTLETDAGFRWHRGMMADSAREKRDRRRRELADEYGDEIEGGPGVPAEAGGGRRESCDGD
jgi:metal-sulfur cluster biosynthetic enzyme